MVDDIQFIAGKVTAQEEFFHTFNALVAAGGQIILTSDRPPSEIARLEERLKSRFEAGFIVDITNPDFELKCAIAQIKAKERNIEIDFNFIQKIAEHLDSPRQIQGIMMQIDSRVNIQGEELNEELINKVLNIEEESRIISHKYSPANFITAVSDYYSIGKRALIGKGRTKNVVQGRHALMYLLRYELDLPFQEIGRLIGGRDHSTVMHAVKKLDILSTNNVHFSEDIRRIKNSL